MKDKFSIIGIILSSFSIFSTGLALHYWSINDDASTFLAFYLSKFTALFFTTQTSQLSITSEGLTITEETTIYVICGFAVFCSITSIVFSFIAMRKLENIVFSTAALLLGNAVFILYDIKTALIILILSGSCAIYLKQQPTKPLL